MQILNIEDVHRFVKCSRRTAASFSFSLRGVGRLCLETEVVGFALRRTLADLLEVDVGGLSLERRWQACFAADVGMPCFEPGSGKRDHVPQESTIGSRTFAVCV